MGLLHRLYVYHQTNVNLTDGVFLYVHTYTGHVVSKHTEVKMLQQAVGRFGREGLHQTEQH